MRLNRRVFMTTALIHQGPAYELSIDVDSSAYGHHLKFVTFVPTARNPEPQVKFQANLSRAELAELHAAIGRALAGQAVRASRSPGEPVAP
jgi:hypothetical protein